MKLYSKKKGEAENGGNDVTAGAGANDYFGPGRAIRGADDEGVFAGFVGAEGEDFQDERIAI
jgi:hypothetical protein